MAHTAWILLVGLLVSLFAPAAVADSEGTCAEAVYVCVGDWFVVGCSPLLVVDAQDDRFGVLVGQGHFGPDWEWGCLYRGLIGPSKACMVNETLEIDVDTLVTDVGDVVRCVVRAMAMAG